MKHSVRLVLVLVMICGFAVSVAQESTSIEFPLRSPSPIQPIDLRPAPDGVSGILRIDNKGRTTVRLGVPAGTAFVAPGRQMLMALGRAPVTVPAGARGAPVPLDLLCAQAELPDPTPDAAWMPVVIESDEIASKKRYLTQLVQGLEKVDQQIAQIARSIRVHPKGEAVEIEYDGEPLDEMGAHLLRTADWSVDSEDRTQGALNRTVVLQFAFWCLTDNYTDAEFHTRLSEPRFQSAQARDASITWAIRHLLTTSGFKPELFDAQSAEIAYNRGVDRLRNGNPEEAEHLFLSALERRPEYAAALFNLGLAQAGQRQWDNARRAFEAAGNLLPDDADIAYNLGSLACHQERWDDAVRHFEQTLQKDSSHAFAKEWLPRARKRQGSVQ